MQGAPPIDARFELLGTRSEGALTVVLDARDRDGRAVVIKRLQRHLAHDPECASMLDHEARLLAALDHPQVPALIARGHDARGPYLALARVDAPPLALHKRAATEALALTRSLLTVLERVHLLAVQGVTLHVVHRDVCPGNVLAGADGVAHLIDYGIATSAWRAHADRGVMRGTRGYMAPEVITGARDIDARADLFAVGVLLTELLTGRRLYALPLPAMLDDVVEGAVRGPRDLDASVPAALDALARRALEKSPEDRYASAAEFLSALDAL